MTLFVTKILTLAYVRRLLPLFLIVGGGVLQIACNNGQQSGVRVAANIPLTGSLAVYGKAIQRGANLAVEDVQKAAPNGPRIQFDWQDNASTPQTAVTIMQQQYLNPPDIYVSGVRPQTTAIWEQISAKGTPHFVWIFEMYVNPNSHNNLRTWVNFKVEPNVYLDYVDRVKPKRIAILYTNIPSYYDELYKIFLPGLKTRGIPDPMIERYDFDTTDFKALAVKVRDFKPDLIVLQGFQQHLVGLVRAMRPYHLIKDGNTLATYDMLDAADILGPDETEGICFASPRFVTRPDEPAVRNWRNEFTTKYQRPPLYTDAYAYDMTQIVHDSAIRLKLPASSNEWIQALRATNIAGVTGQLHFDDDGSLVTPVEIATFREGKVTPVTK